MLGLGTRRRPRRDACCSPRSLARRLRVAPPILLLALRRAARLRARAARRCTCRPRRCCCSSCPALLYWESLTTSLREIRSNLRVIVLASTLLVIATAAAVAAVGARPRAAVGTGLGAGGRAGADRRHGRRRAGPGAAPPHRHHAAGREPGQRRHRAGRLRPRRRRHGRRGEPRRRCTSPGCSCSPTSAARWPGCWSPGWRPRSGRAWTTRCRRTCVILLTPFSAFLLAELDRRLRRPRRRRLRADHEPGRPAPGPGRHPPA